MRLSAIENFYHYVMNMSWLHNNYVLNEFLCHIYKEPILRVWQMDKIDFHKVFLVGQIGKLVHYEL